jgi:BMFP domain-containing protein YqiC
MWLQDRYEHNASRRQFNDPKGMAMIDLRLIDDLSRKLSESLPPGVGRMKNEAEEQFRLVLARSFEKMNLVSREEFDTQTAVLKRTREKLEQLQEKVAQLEQA